MLLKSAFFVRIDSSVYRFPLCWSAGFCKYRTKVVNGNVFLFHFSISARHQSDPAHVHVHVHFRVHSLFVNHGISNTLASESRVYYEKFQFFK